ncbi:MAG: hypothetical protein V2A67_05755 [Bacteroidota bacterium]
MTEIDNKHGTVLAKLFLINIPVVLLLGTGLLAAFLVIHVWWPVFVSGGLVLAGLFITVVLHFQHVTIRISGEKIQVLYYPVRILANSYKRIEIQKELFAGGKFSSSLLGLRRELILFEWASGEKASYPPVSLLLFSKSDRLKISKLFNV